MKTRKILAVLVASAQLGACVHVPEAELSKVQEEPVPEAKLDLLFRSETLGELKVRSLVYKPAVLPLGGFLKKLSEGRFKAAFHAARLRYSPSNVDDEGIRTIIRNRYVPVLVDVANSGKKSAELKDLALTLEDPTMSVPPVPSEELPSAFEKFNPKAAAANTYNTGVVVVTAAAFLAVIAACVYAQYKNGASGSGLQLPELPKGWAEGLDGEVYNSLHKTTNMEYSNLLWMPKRLEPGKSARGLLFFKVGRPDWSALELKARLNPS